jgi:S-DNA-T family DNA segregation ATPase FtsK/SpoIIIE
MGGNAVRSQMDVRICLRVRERRDVDLILGQGALAAGWDAHALTLAGAFLLSDPEHTTPMRARARLITDAQIRDHAARYALPPARDPDARADSAGPACPDAEPCQARQQAGPPGTLPPTAGRERPPPGGGDDQDGRPRPETALWDALVDAGPDGVSVSELEAACGMARRWVYYRLGEHAQAGRATQVRRGYWRAARTAGSPPAPPAESDGQ